MKFQLAWLHQYFSGDVPDPRHLAERLTSAGFILEGIEGEGEAAILDVEMTANRPDAMNHRGLGRESALALGRAYRDSAWTIELSETGPDAAELASVTIEEPELCSRYSARVIEGLRPGEATAAVKSRLEAIGSSRISGPVDATNHVLWDIGQPLHAFDLDLLAKDAEGRPAIIVRRARPGEMLVTLDGIARTLTPEMLVIADAERPVALAGIMGGLDTAISEKTTRILLESAHFHPPVVRRGAKALGMHTDASHRFERGTDPSATIEGLDRAARMILESNGGSLARGVIDVLARPIPRRTIRLRMKRVAGFLGMDVPEERIFNIFAGLGFTWQSAGEGVLEVTVPTARIDLEIEVDLIEEIIRHVGYATLPETLPPAYNPVEVLPHLVLEERTRDLMAGMGLFEVCTYSFVSGDENAPFVSLAPATAALIANPLGEPFTTMRATPLAGILKSAQQNIRRGQGDIGLFEVGRAYGMDGDKPVESRRVTFLLAGNENVHWAAPARPVDFFDGSGVASALLSGLGVESVTFEKAVFPFLSEGRTARILCGGKPVGWVGVLSPELSARWDLTDPVAGEIDLGLISIPPAPSSIEAPSRFPGSSVDLTVTHRKNLEWRVLAEAIRGEAPAELTGLGVLYQYAGAGVPEGFVKTTVSLAFGSVERSLSREEINGWRDAAARRILRVSETRVDGIDE